MGKNRTIEAAIKEFAPNIKKDPTLQLAFLRGRDAVQSLQNCTKGTDLIIALGGKPTRLGKVKELTVHSYSQMLEIVGETMEEVDADTLKAQAIGVHWNMSRFGNETGWEKYQTELFLKEIICGE